MPANPALYRRMSEPFADKDEAHAATVAFFEELGELREKHRIRDVYVIMGFSWMDEDEELESILPMQYGDASKGPLLTAFAYGVECEEHAAKMGRAVRQGKEKAERHRS